MCGRPGSVGPANGGAATITAPIALRKLGILVTFSQATRAYNEGGTTQLPAAVVLNIGTRRIRRKLSFSSQFVLFETSETAS